MVFINVVIVGIVMVFSLGCAARAPVFENRAETPEKSLNSGDAENPNFALNRGNGRHGASSVGRKVDGGVLEISKESTPYFDDFLGGEAVVALAEGRHREARDLFDEIAESVSDSVLTPRARFLSAFLSEQIGDDPRALKELPPLARDLPLIADIVFFRAARSAFRLSRFEEAAKLAAKIEDDSLNGPDATMLRGDALAAAEKYDDAVLAYRAYIDKRPGGSRRNEADARIIECLSERLDGEDDPNIKKEIAEKAFTRLTRLRNKAPTSHWTDVASQWDKILLRVLGRKAKTRAREQKNAVSAYNRARALMKSMRNSQAEQLLNKAVRLSRPGGGLECSARYDRALVVARQRRHEEAATLFQEASAVCKNNATRLKALYRGAKSFMTAGLCEEAIRLFGEIETAFPYHSYADDARLKTAKCYREMGFRKEFQNLLQTLPAAYPAGDMRAEAMWLLAHDALRRNALADARDALENYHKSFPRETGWYASGRSGYWLGRVEEMLGDREVAMSHYEYVVASSPLTYYMLLAYNRLRGLDLERANELKQKLVPKPDETVRHFPKFLLDEYKNLARGIELHRLQLFDLSAREFEHLRSLPDVPADVHWITALFLRLAGRFHEMHEIARRTNDAWLGRYPTEEELLPWSLAFPTAFEKEVSFASRESNVPNYMIWGVMREESGFDPKIESTANALGLMQLMLPTAKAMAKQIRIRANRRTLRKPKINIRLGAAYLAYLRAKFKNNSILVIAAYNGGEGAIARWHQARPGDHVDLFVEDIPYSQTRGYTKRVLASAARYLFLYEEDHPIFELDLVLP